MFTKLYHAVDNVTRRELGIISRWNARAVLCDEYDITQDGIIEAIENVEDYIGGVLNEPSWGCDVLNLMLHEADISEVEEMALDDAAMGARICSADYMVGKPCALVGFSAKATTALQAVFCGMDVYRGPASSPEVYHLIYTCGLDEDEAELLRELKSNETVPVRTM